MGMDTVELVMALEDEFDIAIPNEDASNLAVVGDMFDYIVRELHNRGGNRWIKSNFGNVFVQQLGVRPEQVVRLAHVIWDLHAD